MHCWIGPFCLGSLANSETNCPELNAANGAVLPKVHRLALNAARYPPGIPIVGASVCQWHRFCTCCEGHYKDARGNLGARETIFVV